ncbi:MAG: DUF481 domain-containing protein [Gemmatimonadota bacterium]|nr:MAG: DUF481 domain-containing protein [Gemmatimonadota bacterium]
MSRRARIRALLRATFVAWAASLNVLAAPQASAQVNIEHLRADEDRRGFSGYFRLDLYVRTGNVELVQIGSLGQLNYVVRVTTFLIAGTDLGWKREKRFINAALLHLRQVYRRGSRVRPEAVVQINYDESRLLAFRSITGGGLRTSLYRSAAVRLWWGSTYLFEHEQLDLEPDAVHPTQTSVHRWSNYLTLNVFFTEQSTLQWTIYVQPRFDDFEDHRILTEARLGAVLSKPIFLVLTFHLHYDSQPPDDTRPVDIAIRSGVEIEF